MNTLLQKSFMAMTFFIVIATTLQAQGYSGGSGTIGDPYQIATKADLKYLSENSGEWSKHFIQTANIAFSNADFQSGGDFYNSGNGFIPIGNSTTKFTGTYNGDKFSISYLFISRSSTDHVGFFGYAQNTISNVYLLSVDITGNNYVGGIAGSSWGNMTGCYSSGTVTGASYCGGLIGWMYNGPTISESGSTCSVSSSGGWVGGIIGRSESGGSVTNCFATGSVYTSGSYAGGLIGGYQNASITYCYSTGSVHSDIGYYGGLVAVESGSGSVYYSFWDTQTSGLSYSDGGTGRTTAQMQSQSTYTDSNWNFSTIWEISGPNYPSLQTISISSIVVTTDAATSIGTTAATLNGTVTTSGDTSAVRFLYGTTSGVYADSVNASPDTVKASTATNVSIGLTGLSDGTKYYYKVIAQGKSEGAYISGSEMNFTTVSTTWGSTVKFGDASNQYAKAGGVATTAVDNVTLEAWIKWDGTGTGGVQAIVTNGYAGTDGYGLYLWTGGQIALLESALGWHYSDSIPATNQWVHLALVRNSGTWTAYKDGQSIAFTYNDAFQTPITPYTNLFIGGDSIGYRFHGEIDEVRVSDIARYSTNFSVPLEPFTSDGNTVGLYHFDEGSGSTVDDASSHANDLTMFNSPTWMGSDNPNVVPLPVELTSFTVSAAQFNAELRWKTATEVNNHGFEIERKGASSWNTVGFVQGNGTTNAPKEYSFTDKSLSSGTYQYRLKQVDRDGSFEYSQAVEVIVGSVPVKFELSQNYPNPFNPTTTIGFTLQKSGHTTLKVYDAIGREVAVLANEVLDAGVHHHRMFNAGSLASGVYFARLTSGGIHLHKKLLLLK